MALAPTVVAWRSAGPVGDHASITGRPPDVPAATPVDRPAPCVAVAGKQRHEDGVFHVTMTVPEDVCFQRAAILRGDDGPPAVAQGAVGLRSVVGVGLDVVAMPRGADVADVAQDAGVYDLVRM